MTTACRGLKVEVMAQDNVVGSTLIKGSFFLFLKLQLFWLWQCMWQCWWEDSCEKRQVWTWLTLYYFAPTRVQNVVMSVSVCLSLCLYIWKTIHPNFTQFSVHAAHGCTSVLLSLSQECNMLCTPGLWMTIKVAHMFNVTHQGAALRAKSDVCNCLIDLVLRLTVFLVNEYCLSEFGQI